MRGTLTHAHGLPGPVTRKRIAIVALPTLMEDLVRRACASDGSVEVVEPSVASVKEFLRDPAMHNVEVIITAAGNSGAVTAPRALLERAPTARLRWIEQFHGEGVLVELLPSRRTLGPVSSLDLLRAIANDSAHRAAWSVLDEPSWRGRA